LKTILFIDNYDSYRFLLQEELLEEGFEVITAKNIEEALLTLKGVKPALLILDLSEKATREESFDKLKKKYPDIPWVGHSAYVECPCEFKKWINYYISKSPEIDGIRELVRSL